MVYAPDFSKPFLVQTDVSDVSLGVVLFQPGAYIGRKLQPREQGYTTIEKECLALKWAIDSFFCYLVGQNLQ